MWATTEAHWGWMGGGYEGQESPLENLSDEAWLFMVACQIVTTQFLLKEVAEL